MITTRRFWIVVRDRAIRTAAQFALYSLGLGVAAAPIDDTTAALVTELLVGDLGTVARTLVTSAAGGALVSVLTSLAFTPPVEVEGAGPDDLPARPRHVEA